jgi:arginine decarboxylase
LIDRDENGNITTELFSEQQKSEDLLKILGYDVNQTEEADVKASVNGMALTNK